MLKRIIKEAKLKSSEAFVAIPAFGGLVTLIDFPNMPSAEMEQAIKFEAHKYIPTSLDDVVISWEIVGDNDISEKNEVKKGTDDSKINPKKKTQVLLVAASKKKVLAYEKAIKNAGLKLRGVEIENISLVESLVGSDSGDFIIVDIGFYACNIIYVESGVIKSNRNIDVGGDHITKAIAKSLGITNGRAEKMKISGSDFFSTESSLKFSSFDIILGEVFRILDTLPKKDGRVQIDALILSGGTARMVGLKDFFQRKTNIKTIIGDPFSRVEYDKKLEKTISGMKGTFAVCMGLALRGIKNKK